MDRYAALLKKWREDVKLGEKLGEGFVSVVYSVAPTTTTTPSHTADLEQYALKISREPKSLELVLKERDVYSIWNDTKEKALLPHIPKFYGSYQKGDLAMIVIERMKMDLDGYLEKENVIGKDKFSNIAVKLVDCVQSFHRYGYVHRDLKPSNIGIRQPPEGLEFCIFDMTTCYRTNMANFTEHSQRPRDVFVGTPSFASVAAMNNLEPFYIDDLESLGYILLYIAFKQHLPWENSKAREILQQKKQILTTLGNAKNAEQYQKALLEIVFKYFSYLAIKQWAWKPKDADYEELKSFLSGSKEPAAASSSSQADPIIAKDEKQSRSRKTTQQRTYSLRSRKRSPSAEYVPSTQAENVPSTQATPRYSQRKTSRK